MSRDNCDVCGLPYDPPPGHKRFGRYEVEGTEDDWMCQRCEDVRYAAEQEALAGTYEADEWRML